MLNHKQKVKLARKLRTTKDIKEHKPIFNTENWNKRKEAIEQKTKKTNIKKIID